MGSSARRWLVVPVLGAVVASCRSSAPDAGLLGTWQNDDDPGTVLVLVENPGGSLTPPTGFSGTVGGALTSPSSPGRFLVDVRRDALGAAFFVIPAFAGLKDILCEGCAVSPGHIVCSEALATTTDSYGGTV